MDSIQPPVRKHVDVTKKSTSAWQLFFIVANLVLFLYLMSATVVYAGVRLAAGGFSRTAWFDTAGAFVWMVGFIVLLYFAEGSEIAVTTIVDRNEDELVLSSSAKALLRRLNDNINDFVSGRQFIVIVLVVLFAAFCEDFVRYSAELAKTAVIPPHWLVAAFFSPIPVKFYAFGFPILTALWLSQLYSKFVAQRRPVTFFQDARRIIAPSLWLGRTVMVGFVSTKLAAYALRGKPEDARTPSRSKMYEALAAFRDGFGFDTTEVRLTINPADGSLDVIVRCHVHAYASGATLFAQKDIWDGPIIGEMDVSVSRAATLGEFTFRDDRKRVDWSFLLAKPLQSGEQFNFEARYHVGAGGVKFGQGSVGEFFYEQRKYPMRNLVVVVRLTDTSTLILNPGRIIATISDDGETDSREAARSGSRVVAKDGGIDFHLEYPLMGGTYTCEWTMAVKAKGLQLPL